MRQVVLSWIVLPLVLWVSPAFAASFGERGTLAPGGSINITYADVYGSESVFVAFNPAATYFVIDNLGVGLGLHFLHYEIMGRRGLAVNLGGISPRIGYNLGFSPRLSFFPQFSLVLTFGGSGGLAAQALPYKTDVGLTLTLEAPLLIHIGNFYVGVGPYTSAGVVNAGGPSARVPLVVGLATSFGGYFSLGEGTAGTVPSRSRPESKGDVTDI